MSRVDRFKKKRDNIKSGNELHLASGEVDIEFEKIKKRIKKIDSSLPPELVSFKIDSGHDKDMVSKIKLGSLHDPIDTSRLDAVIHDLKNVSKKANRIENTESNILRNAVAKDVSATTTIDNIGESNSNVTQIIKEIEKSKEAKEILIAKEKVAINELNKRLVQNNDISTDDDLKLYGDRFDDITLERVKEIGVQKISIDHTKATLNKLITYIIIIILLFLVVMIILDRFV